jgi:hypothetical protein
MSRGVINLFVYAVEYVFVCDKEYRIYLSVPWNTYVFVWAVENNMHLSVL